VAGQVGSTLRGVVTISMMTLNVFFWCMPLFAAAIAKLIVPLDSWRRAMSRVLVWIAERWIYSNNAIFRLMAGISSSRTTGPGSTSSRCRRRSPAGCHSSSSSSSSS